MDIPEYNEICIPKAPGSITKGQAIKNVLNENAVGFLARNIFLANSDFDAEKFYRLASDDLESKSLMDRARYIAFAIFTTLPKNYKESIEILIDSMPPPMADSEKFGLGVFFFLPYSFFISEYGLSSKYNDGVDPFETSMRAHRELTLRFSAEFSIRPFLVSEQERTLAVIHSWVNDPSSHIRRLCSEGIRPRLPWGMRLSSFIKDPLPILPILDLLKNDSSLYVRRSVANNLGDIAKDHPSLIFDLCEQWLQGADANLRWVIRHAIRYHIKRKIPKALLLREQTKT